MRKISCIVAFRHPSSPIIFPNGRYNTQDGLYDVAWSEVHENQLVSASGDGSLKLWDITINVRILPSTLSRLALRRALHIRMTLSLYPGGRCSGAVSFFALGLTDPSLARTCT